MFREREQSAEQTRLGPREAGRRGNPVSREAAGAYQGPSMTSKTTPDRSGPDVHDTATPLKLDAPSGERRVVELPPVREDHRAGQDRKRADEPRRGFLP